MNLIAHYLFPQTFNSCHTNSKGFTVSLVFKINVFKIIFPSLVIKGYGWLLISFHSIAFPKLIIPQAQKHIYINVFWHNKTDLIKAGPPCIIRIITRWKFSESSPYRTSIVHIFQRCREFLSYYKLLLSSWLP